MTPTASAAPSVRASARARPRRADQHVRVADAPRRTPSPRRTGATGPGSWCRRASSPSASAPHHDDVVAGPQEEQIGRGPSEDDAAVAVERAVASGRACRRGRARPRRCRRPARGGVRSAAPSLPHWAMTADASTVGRNGPGATWRPISSRTTTSSLEPGSRATVLLGQVDAEPAQLRHLLPEGRAGLGVGLEQGPVRRQRVVVVTARRARRPRAPGARR